MTFIWNLHYEGVAQIKDNGYAPGQYPIDSVEYEKICPPKYAPQYYQLSAKNRKSSYQILNEWLATFKKPPQFTQSGFLTVRFIVNCKGELCCFNVYEMDEAYQKTSFDADVKTQLLDFIKKWAAGNKLNMKENPSIIIIIFILILKTGIL